MEIVIVSGDMDWQGLYINGHLVYEGHSIPTHVPIEAIISRLPRLNMTLETKYVDENWMDNRGSLPKELKEVKLSDG